MARGNAGITRLVMVSEELGEFKAGRLRLLAPSADPILFFETWILGVYSQLALRRGDYVIDIGANIGDFTVLASDAVGPSGRVLSIEPSPYWFPILQRNIALNHLANVVPLQLAVSDSRGMTEVKGASPESGGRTEIGTHGSQVAADTLDNILRDLGWNDVDAMKMDIEGSELLALRGQRVLGMLREVILETHGRENYRRVKDLLTAQGFNLGEFTRADAIRNVAAFAARHPIGLFNAELGSRFLGVRSILRLARRGMNLAVTNTDEHDLSIVHGVRVR